jgi:hypothetical protein
MLAWIERVHRGKAGNASAERAGLRQRGSSWLLNTNHRRSCAKTQLDRLSAG